MDRGKRRDLERPTVGEELFELDPDFVPVARVGGGLPSHPSGVLLSEQFPLSLPLPANEEDDVPSFVCLRKPKLIFGIRLPNPPPPPLPADLALPESDIELFKNLIQLLLASDVLLSSVECRGDVFFTSPLVSRVRWREEMILRPEVVRSLEEKAIH